MIDPKRRKEIEDRLGLASDQEYLDNSAKWASQIGVPIDELDAMRKQAREQRAKDVGSEPIDARFFGYDNADEAFSAIDKFKSEVVKDITFVSTSKEYIEAAAALLFYDEAGFMRLVANLKASGLTSHASWADKIRRAMRQRRDQMRASGVTGPGFLQVCRGSVATTLIQLAKDNSQLFHDADQPYASVKVDGHVETHALRSRGFKQWLAGLYFDQSGKGANTEALGAAINTLAAFADRGPEHKVHLRIAPYKDDEFYIDLTNQKRDAIKVTSIRWSVVSS